MTSNTTSALTGLAGSRNVGTPSRPKLAEALHGAGMHGDAVDVHFAEVDERRAHRLGRGAADRAGDHHDLGAIELTLNDFAEFLADRC